MLLLTSVWTPATVTAAVVAGLGVGYFLVGFVASLPAYASGIAAAWKYGIVTALTATLGGGIFYVGQAAAALADGDPGFDRLFSRWALWALYSVMLGIGAWARLHRYYLRRATAVKERAHQEVRTS